jgi:phospholipid/cholesterol/gamma-HCH transport system ATP-binding protein
LGTESAKPIEPPILLELQDVAVTSARAPESVLLSGVNWSVRAGDYWVVGGLPGSGKTELLAVAAGLQRPARGTHRLFGRDLTRLSEAEQLRERLRLGMVFNLGGRLFSHLTVAENVALPLCYHRNWTAAEASQQVETVLETTGLLALAHRRPDEVSHSWRQRAGLARGLALQPEMLLLENPIAGLELRHRQWWLEFLVELAGGHAFVDHRPMTLIIATHDLQRWTNQARQFALLDRGRWLLLGDRRRLDSCTEPVLRELLVTDATAG